MQHPDPAAAHDEVVAERQRRQPVELARVQLVAPPLRPGSVIAAVGEERLPVALNGREVAFPDEPDAGGAARPLADYVAEIHDPGDAAGVEVGQDGLQGREVAMDVGDDSHPVE